MSRVPVDQKGDGLMSGHPLDDAQLDACVEAAVEDSEAALDAGLFEVKNKSNANKAVWKIGRIEGDLAEDEALYRAELARLDAWITDRRLRAERAIEFLTTLTAGYHAILLEQDPKRKTVKLPAGDLVARKQPDVWAVDDADYLIEWAKQSGWGEVVRQRDPEVDRAALKKTFHVAPGGSVIAPDGERVPGVTVTPGEIRYVAKPRVVDE